MKGVLKYIRVEILTTISLRPDRDEHFNIISISIWGGGMRVPCNFQSILIDYLFLINVNPDE